MRALSGGALSDFAEEQTIRVSMAFAIAMVATATIPIAHDLWSDSREIRISYRYEDIAIKVTEL